jgi:hypothetical protein
MEIEFTLDKADLVAYAQHHRKSSGKAIQSKIHSTKVFWWLMLPSILAIGMLIDEGRLGVPVAFVLLLSAFVLWQKWYVSKYYTIFYSEEYSKGLLGSRKIILDKDLFIEATSFKKAHYLWRGIEQIIHTPTHIFITPNKVSAFVVPRRVFQNEAEFKAFENELEACWRAGQSGPESTFPNPAT